MKRPLEDLEDQSPAASTVQTATESPQTQSTAASTPPAVIPEPSVALIKERILDTHSILSAYTSLRQRCQALETEVAKNARNTEMLLRQRLQQERLDTKAQAQRIKQLEEELSHCKHVLNSRSQHESAPELQARCAQLQQELHAKSSQITLLEGEITALRTSQAQVHFSNANDLFDMYDINLADFADSGRALDQFGDLSESGTDANMQSVRDETAVLDPSLQANSQVSHTSQPRIKVLPRFQ
jgi:DNA repair exonuclease SbcCD ATPase subunit